jgi:hypothetical protein
MASTQDTSLRQSHLRNLLYGQRNNCLDEADESPPASPSILRRLASGPPTPKAERPNRGIVTFLLHVQSNNTKPMVFICNL